MSFPRLKIWERVIVLLLIMVVSQPAHADKARSFYKRGTQAETRNQYDAAFEAYKQAHELKPRDPKYLAAYVRLRFYSAAEHVRSGQLLFQSGKLPEALAEFQHAAEIDTTSFVAREETRRTANLLRRQEQEGQVPPPEPVSPLAKRAREAGGPVDLGTISNSPISLVVSANTDSVYKIIGNLAGINVLFDSEYRPQKISVELNDVTAREALDMVALQSKTFWEPVSPNTIFVAGEGKRKDLQNNVMKTFYLGNISNPSELQEAANTLKGILDIGRIQLIPKHNAMVLRGTMDQMVLAEKLLEDIDKPTPEVVIDIAVMQVSRSHIRTLGTSPPTSASISIIPGQPNGGGNSGSALTLNSLTNLNANNFLVSIPSATLSMLMSDSNTKVIQNPEVRALDNEKATLKIGDRVPVATGSFSPGTGGVGISALVNTQFQYLDVGVNIDITPHIHSEGEVTLRLALEVSSVTGSQNIGGISQPIIGQRRIEHETRLRDGDVNLVGGILEDSETHSLSGYPWLAKVPILRYLFGQEEKDRQENEIVFAITPHIVRGQFVTEQNLRLVDVGNGNVIGIRRKEEKASAVGQAASAHPNGSGQPKPKDRGSDHRNFSHPRAGTSQENAPGQDSEGQGVSPTSGRVGTSRSAENAPSQQTGRPPSSQQAADPCSSGQHLVNLTKDVVECAFD